MKPPTNYDAIAAAGGWNLSTAFLSAKAKAQARDSKGRFIKMGGMVRWKGTDGWRWGFVVGVSPDGKAITVHENGKAVTAKIQPKLLEVVKAIIPESADEAKTLAEAQAKAKKGNLSGELVNKLPYKAEDLSPIDDADDDNDKPLYVDTSGFKKVGGQAGSNAGGVYEGPDGTQYYVKKAQSEQHAANEVLAAKLYQQAGITLPEIYLTEFPDGGGPAIASKMIDGLKPMFPNGQTTPLKLKVARKGFAMDAWLANWDSIGLEYDNMMMKPNGGAVRVDPGGALLYRAMGSPKGALFGDTVGETETLRNASMNAQAAKVFGGMSDQDIAQDIENTVNKVDLEYANELIDELPFSSDAIKTDLKAKLKNRKADLNTKFDVPQPEPESEPKAEIPDAPDAPAALDFTTKPDSPFAFSEMKVTDLEAGDWVRYNFGYKDTQSWMVVKPFKPGDTTLTVANDGHIAGYVSEIPLNGGSKLPGYKPSKAPKQAPLPVEKNLDGTFPTMAINLNKGDLIKVKGAHIVELDNKFSTDKGVTGTYLAGNLKGGKYQEKAHKSTKFSKLDPDSKEYQDAKAPDGEPTPTAELPKASPPVVPLHGAPKVQQAELSDSEIEALDDYIDEGFEVVNDYLRHGNPAEADLAEDMIGSLDAMIAKSTLSADATVWRGVSTDGWLEGTLEPGTAIEDKGFLSTSAKQSVAVNFAADQDTPYAAVFQINVPAGTHVIDVVGTGLGGGEQEFIFPRGSRLTVSSDTVDADGKRQITADLTEGTPGDGHAGPKPDLATVDLGEGPGDGDTAVPEAGPGAPGTNGDDAGPGDGDTSPAAGLGEAELLAKLEELRSQADVASAKVQSVNLKAGKGGVLTKQEISDSDAAYAKLKILRAQAKPLMDALWAQKKQDVPDLADPDEARWSGVGGLAKGGLAKVGDLDPATWDKFRDMYVVNDPKTLQHNASLRSENPAPASKAWATKVDKMVAQHQLKNDSLLYRGGAFSPEFLATLVPGSVLDDKGFQSTGDLNDAHFYGENRAAMKPGTKHAVFEIQVPAGQSVTDVGYGEYVLPRNSKMLIKSVRESDDSGGNTNAPGVVYITAELAPNGDLSKVKAHGGAPGDAAPKPVDLAKAKAWLNEQLAEQGTGYTADDPFIQDLIKDALDEGEMGSPVTIKPPSGSEITMPESWAVAIAGWDNPSNGIAPPAPPAPVKVPAVGTAAKDVKPGDKVAYGSKTWTVKSVKPGTGPNAGKTVVDLGGGGQVFPNDYEFGKASDGDAPAGPPKPPPVDPPVANGGDDDLPHPSAKIGAKVTSKKDGFSGKVVKVNPNSGYSLVQSDDGTKKLWRKWDTLEVSSESKHIPGKHQGKKYTPEEEWHKGLITSAEYTKLTGKPTPSASAALSDLYAVLSDDDTPPTDVAQVLEKMGFLDDINAGEEATADGWITNVITEFWANGDLEGADAVANSYDALKKDAGIAEGFHWDSPGGSPAFTDPSQDDPVKEQAADLNNKADAFSQALELFTDPADVTPEHLAELANALNAIGDGSLQVGHWASLKEFADEWAGGEDGSKGWQLKEAWTDLLNAAGLTDEEIDDPGSSNKLNNGPETPPELGDTPLSETADALAVQNLIETLSSAQLDAFGLIDPDDDVETKKAWLLEAFEGMNDSGIEVSGPELAAFQQLADALGVPVPEQSQNMSPAVTNYLVTDLAIGDEILYNGKPVEIDSLTSGAYSMTIHIVPVGGGTGKFIYVNKLNSLPVTKKAPKPDLPVKTTAGLAVGDKVAGPGGKPWLITELNDAGGGYSIWYESETGLDHTIFSGYDATWEVISEAAPTEVPDDGAKLPTKPASEVNVGDEISIGEGPTKGVVTQVDTNSYGNHEIYLATDEGPTVYVALPHETATVHKTGISDGPDDLDGTEFVGPTDLETGDLLYNSDSEPIGTVSHVEYNEDSDGYDVHYWSPSGAEETTSGSYGSQWLVKAGAGTVPSEPGGPQTLAASELKAGDKILDVDGDTGQIESIEKLPSGKLKIAYKVDEYGDQDFTMNIDPSNTTWFKKVGDGPAPKKKKTGPVQVKDLQPGDKVTGNSGTAHYLISSVVESTPGTYIVDYTDLSDGQHFTDHFPGESHGFVTPFSYEDDTIDATPPDAPVASKNVKDYKSGDKVIWDGKPATITTSETSSYPQDGEWFLSVQLDDGGYLSGWVSNNPDGTVKYSNGEGSVKNVTLTSADAPASPTPTPAANAGPSVGDSIAPSQVKPGMTIKHHGGVDYKVISVAPGGNDSIVTLHLKNEASGGDYPNFVMQDIPGSFTLAAEAPESAPEPSKPEVPTGTLVPGSSHVFQDAKGKYVVNNKGHVLREGDKVTAKNGETGTIKKFELDAKYAKVKFDDGKTKVRQIDTLSPVTNSPVTVAPIGAPAPTATPAPSGGPVSSPTVLPTGMAWQVVETVKAPGLKAGQVVGNDKKTLEYQKASTKVPGKWELKFVEDAEPITVSQNVQQWQIWEPKVPGKLGKKDPSDFTAGDVIELPDGSKHVFESLSEWGDTVGQVDVKFKGEPGWQSIPEGVSYQIWEHGTPTTPAGAPAPAAEPAGPVVLTHDPIDFSFPEGATLSVPAGGTVHKPQWWSHGKPVLVDGFLNSWEVDPATGEKKLHGESGYYAKKLLPDSILFTNENHADVEPNLSSVLPSADKAVLLEKVGDYLLNGSDSAHYGYKQYFTALQKWLNDPTSGEALDGADWSNAQAALNSSTIIGGWKNSEQWAALGNELLKARKKHTGSYPNEWNGPNYGSGQFFYNQNERKALSALGLSENANAFVATKHTHPGANADAAAEIHAITSDSNLAEVIDDLFGKGTSAAITKKTRGANFKPALSGNGSPYAKPVPELPKTAGKNGTVIYLGDNVIASDGQGGKVSLVTGDGKVRVLRSDGSSFTRKGTQFVVTSSPVTGTKPSAAQTAEAKPYTAKPRPEFKLPDWSQGNIGGTAGLKEVLDRIKTSNEAGNVGWSFAGDAGQIEDLDVHVSRVLSPQGQELIELKFKLTPKQGNAMYKRHSADSANWADTTMKIDGRQVTSYDKLSQLTGAMSYTSSNGRTLVKSKSDGTEIRFHRANSKEMNYTKHNPVAFHNLVQIRLPADATPSDIAKAMYDAGVDDPSPASKAAVLRTGENKLLSLFAKKTDAWVGNDSIQNRETLLKDIETKWGITANDLEIAHGANGRFEIRLPEKVAEQLVKQTGVNYFAHSITGGGSILKIAKNPFHALLSTSTRRTEGVKHDGMSSTEDIHTGGAEYVFTHPRSTLAPLHNQIVFDAKRLFRRMDWFSQDYDSFGKHTSGLDIVGKTNASATESMFKHRLDLDDAVGYIVGSESQRQQLITQLKAEGITKIGSRTVEEFIIVSPGTNIPAPTPPVPTVPIASLSDAGVGGPAL